MAQSTTRLLVAVVLGLRAAARIGAAPAGAAGDSALAKIERVLPPGPRDRVQALPDTLGFTQPAREAYAPVTAHLLALGAAARNRRRVRLAYRSWRGAEVTRALANVPYAHEVEVLLHAGVDEVRTPDTLRDAVAALANRLAARARFAGCPVT